MLVLATLRTNAALSVEQQNVGVPTSKPPEVGARSEAGCDLMRCESTNVQLEDGLVCLVSDSAALAAARLAAATASVCSMAAVTARIANKRNHVNELFSTIEGARVHVEEPDVAQRPSTPRSAPKGNRPNEVTVAAPETAGLSHAMRRIGARDMSLASVPAGSIRIVISPSQPDR